MPSPWHDSVNELIELDPEIAITILRDFLGEPLKPDLAAHLAPPRFNDRPSTDFDCDTVVIAGPHRDPEHGIVIEAQRQKGTEKREQLARYAAELWLLLRCPVDVLVICPDEDVCAFYAEPVVTTLRGFIHTARPLHPGLVPVITDPGQMAANPSTAVIVLAVHGDEPGVADAFFHGMNRLGDPGELYNEIGIGLAQGQAKRRLEALMALKTIPRHSEWALKHYANGEAAGKASTILLVLESRGLTVTDEQRTDITTCTDLAQLDDWAKLAATVRSTEELFQ